MGSTREPLPVKEREAYYYEPIDGHLRRAARGGTREIHLGRGTCNELVDRGGEEPEQCGFNSKFRKLTDEGIVDLCGFHVPQSWEEVAENSDARSFDAIALDPHEVHEGERQEGCVAWVSSNSRRGDRQSLTSKERPDGPVGYHRCGDRPLVLFVKDGTVQEGFCYKHIRPDWIERLRV